MAMAQPSFALHVTKNLWPWHSSMISQQVTSPIFVTRQTPRYFTYSLKVIFQHNVERSIAFFPPLRIYLFSTRQDSLLLLQNGQQMKGKKGLESGERSNPNTQLSPSKGDKHFALLAPTVNYCPTERLRNTNKETFATATIATARRAAMQAPFTFTKPPQHPETCCPHSSWALTKADASLSVFQKAA